MIHVNTLDGRRCNVVFFFVVVLFISFFFFVLFFLFTYLFIYLFCMRYVIKQVNACIRDKSMGGLPSNNSA